MIKDTEILGDDYYSKRLLAFARHIGFIIGTLETAVKWDSSLEELQKSVHKVLSKDKEFDKIMFGDKSDEKE